MSSETKHISKQQYCELITGRMQRYAEALQGGGTGSLTQHILPIFDDYSGYCFGHLIS